MKTNSAKGRNFVVIIGVYLIAKTVLNMIIGGGFNIFDLVAPVICFLAMFSGLEYLNYAVAVIIAIPVLKNMLYNVTHLPSSLIYLAEAVVDVGAILLLVIQNDIKTHFTNKWSEFSSLFK
ncbi:MAG: hypothetical protein NC340_08745 [Ruminococcus flavefaciens]|nr:hypothetical protein [Ruminococcus flavefaciens]MCM1230571.1 hypothetical protein [Ruminococcus flavefaciens]